MTTDTHPQCDPHCSICGGTGTTFGKRCVCADRAMAFADQMAMTQCPVGPIVGSIAAPSPVCTTCRRVPCRCHTAEDQAEVLASAPQDTLQDVLLALSDLAAYAQRGSPSQGMVIALTGKVRDALMVAYGQIQFRTAAPVAQEGEHSKFGSPELQAMIVAHATKPTPSDSGSVDTPTDLSEQLRERARGDYTAVHTDDGALMLKAADEIERYYGGMLAWKKTAEKKDRDWNDRAVNACREVVAKYVNLASEGKRGSIKQNRNNWKVDAASECADAVNALKSAPSGETTMTPACPYLRTPGTACNKCGQVHGESAAMAAHSPATGNKES